MTLPDIGSGLPEIVLRTAVVYLFLVVALRLSGKREVGQMSILELIVILIISDAVQNSMVGDNVTLWGGLVDVLTLIGLDLGLKALIGRSRRLRNAVGRLRNAVEGEPRLLIRDGRLLDKALRKEGWNRNRSARPSARTGSNGSKTFVWRSSRLMVHLHHPDVRPAMRSAA